MVLSKTVLYLLQDGCMRVLCVICPSVARSNSEACLASQVCVLSHLSLSEAMVANNITWASMLCSWVDVEGRGLPQPTYTAHKQSVLRQH